MRTEVERLNGQGDDYAKMIKYCSQRTPLWDEGDGSQCLPPACASRGRRIWDSPVVGAKNPYRFGYSFYAFNESVTIAAYISILTS